MMKKYSQAGNAVSRRVFHIVTWTTALVFGVFWFVGYDTPYDENCNFIAPMFTDVLLGFVTLMLVSAVAILVWAVIRSLRVRGAGGRVVNNIQAKRIAYCTTVAVVAIMALTFALGSSETQVINGHKYSDTQWLRIADMFVGTVLTLMVAGVAIIIVAMICNGRRKK